VQRIPDAERHRFYADHSAPLANTNVWISGFTGGKAGVDYIFHAELLVDQHQRSAIGPQANYICTMIVGSVVLRVACYREASQNFQLRFAHQPEFDKYLIPIWPSYFTVEWPGGEVFNAEQFMTFCYVVPGALRFTYPPSRSSHLHPTIKATPPTGGSFDCCHLLSGCCQACRVKGRSGHDLSSDLAPGQGFEP
jgi:hypothetical protein